MTAACAASSLPDMTKLTRFALAHRRLVILAWVVLAIAGALTASSTTNGLSHSVATPGTAGSEGQANIRKRLGLDGNEQPTVAVLHLPAGRTMRTAAGQALAAHTFEA